MSVFAYEGKSPSAPPTRGWNVVLASALPLHSANAANVAAPNPIALRIISPRLVQKSDGRSHDPVAAAPHVGVVHDRGPGYEQRTSSATADAVAARSDSTGLPVTGGWTACAIVDLRALTYIGICQGNDRARSAARRPGQSGAAQPLRGTICTKSPKRSGSSSLQDQTRRSFQTVMSGQPSHMFWRPSA
jgi:hypothetical protein